MALTEAQLVRLLEKIQPPSRYKPTLKPVKFSGKPAEKADTRAWLEDIDGYAKEAGLKDGASDIPVFG